MAFRAEGSLQSLGVLVDLSLLWAVVCTGATLRAVEELALYLRDVCFTEVRGATLCSARNTCCYGRRMYRIENTDVLKMFSPKNWLVLRKIF